MAALYLKKPTQSVTLDAAPPFEATLTYSDQSTVTFASSIEAGVPTITPERETWLRDSDGIVLFDSNKQLLEASA